MSRGFVDNENVVSMQFDNREFEKNVHQSLGTLDKLKQALNFQGAVKGVEELNSYTRELDANTNILASAVGAVSNKFSALEIAGITAISRITNKVIDLGERLVKSLTVDQLAAGWSKYEEKISAVQTIMSATATTWEQTANRIGFTGTQMEFVNEQLDRLNWFSDETSYSFSDMTNNIGKFTSVGVELDKAVTAMEGISLWAAKSGVNAQRATSAYYNLAQAMSIGSVQQIDWKTIEGLNMATIEFKQTAIDTAVRLGTLKKAGKGVFKTLAGGEVTVENVRDRLKDDWFTSDVLMETLEIYGKAATRISEISEDYGIQTTKFLSGIKDWQNGTRDITDIANDIEIAVEDLIPLFEELSSKEYELGLSAFMAGQEAKTFSEVLSATKDAVSTKWMDTWELIFGDYEHAKELWSGVAEEFYDIFAAPGDARNELLEQTMGNAWDQVIGRINAAGIATSDFEKKLTENLRLAGIPIDALVKQYGSLGEAIKHVKDIGQHIRQTILSFTEPITGSVEGIQNATAKLDEFQKVVNQVIRGNFKSGKERVERLTKAGYDYATVQGLVNKVWEKNNHTWKDTTITMDDLIDVMGKMSDKELESIGMTRDEVSALQELKLEVGTIGSDIDNLIKRVHKKSGKELIFNSIAHAISAIKKAIDVVRGAWRDVFPAKTSEELYGFLEAIEKITEWLDANDETLDKLKRTLRGIFSISGIFRDLIVAALRVFLPDLLAGTSEVGGGLLDLTARLGDAIFNFREFMKSGELLTNILGYLKDMFLKSKEVLGELIKKGLELPVVSKILEGIADAVEKIKKFFKELWDIFYDAIIEDETTAFEALVRVFERLYDAFKGLEEKYPILTDIKDALSEFFSKFKEYGKDVLEGFLEGIGGKGLLEQIKTKMTEFAEMVYNTFADWMGIHSPATKFVELALYCIAGFLVGIIEGTIYVVSAIRNFAKSIYDETTTLMDENPDSPVTKLRNYIKAAFEALKGFFTDTLNAIKATISKIGEYVKNTDVLDKFIGAIKYILALLFALSMIRLTFGIGKLASGIGEAAESISGFFDSWAFKNYTTVAKNITICVGIISAVVYLLARLTPEQFDRAMIALAAFSALVSLLAIVIYALSKVTNSLNNAKLAKKNAKIEFAKVWGVLQNASMILAIGMSLYYIVKSIGEMKNMLSENTQQFEDALLLIGIIAAVLFAATNYIAKIQNGANTGKLIGVAAVIFAISWALSSMVDTVNKYFFKKDKNGNTAISIKNVEDLVQLISGVITVIALVASLFTGAAFIISNMKTGTAKMFGVASMIFMLAVGARILINGLTELMNTIFEIHNEFRAFNSPWYEELGFFVSVLIMMAGLLAALVGAAALLSVIIKSNDIKAKGGLIGAGIFLIALAAACWIITKALAEIDDVIYRMKNPIGSIVTLGAMLLLLIGGISAIEAFSSKAKIGPIITSLGGIAAICYVFGLMVNEILKNDNFYADDVASIAWNMAGSISVMMGVVAVINKFVYGGKDYDIKGSIGQLAELIGLAIVLYSFGEEVAKLSTIGWDSVQPVMQGIVEAMLCLYAVIEVVDYMKNLFYKTSGLKDVFGDFDLAVLFGGIGAGMYLLAEGLASLLAVVNNTEDYGTKMRHIWEFIAAILVLLGIFITVMAKIAEASKNGVAMIALVFAAMGIFMLGLAALLAAISYFVENEKLSGFFEKILGWIDKIIAGIIEAIGWLGKLFQVHEGAVVIDPKTGEWILNPNAGAVSPWSNSSSKSSNDDTEKKKKQKQYEKDQWFIEQYGGPNKSGSRPAGPNDEIIQGHTININKAQGLIFEEGIQVASAGMLAGGRSTKLVEVHPENLLNWGTDEVIDALGSVEEGIKNLEDSMYMPNKGGGVSTYKTVTTIPDKLTMANDMMKGYNEWKKTGDWTALLSLAGDISDDPELQKTLLTYTKMISDSTSQGISLGTEANYLKMVDYLKQAGVDEETMKLFQNYGYDYGTEFGNYFYEGTTNTIEDKIKTKMAMENDLFHMPGMTSITKDWEINKVIGTTPNYDIFGMSGLGGFGNTVVQFPEKMETTSPDVVKAIETSTATLNTGINGLYTKIKGLYVRLDTGAMVGSLSPYISREIKGYVDQYAR